MMRPTRRGGTSHLAEPDQVVGVHQGVLVDHDQLVLPLSTAPDVVDAARVVDEPTRSPGRHPRCVAEPPGRAPRTPVDVAREFRTVGGP